MLNLTHTATILDSMRIKRIRPQMGHPPLSSKQGALPRGGLRQTRSNHPNHPRYQHFRPVFDRLVRKEGIGAWARALA